MLLLYFYYTTFSSVWEDLISVSLDSEFRYSQNALAQTYKDELKESCFIPLLDSNKPHESANYISRQLVQNGIIESGQSMFLPQIVDYHNRTNFTNLIIVDDCVGSGHQLTDFWMHGKVNVNGTTKLLREYCAENNIHATYLTLFGYNVSIKELSEKFSDLNIVCVRELNDSLRVFNKNSYIWENEKELDYAKSVFSEYAMIGNVSLYGYNLLDFAFIMHRTIPDWSLPILWTDNADWKHLMRRKNSNG